jgi:two-component system, NtrC family, response regulator GlrR
MECAPGPGDEGGGVEAPAECGRESRSADSRVFSRVVRPATPIDATFLRRPAPFAYRTFPKLVWSDSEGEHALVLDRLVVVGSSERAHVRIHDPTVSRLHVELQPKEDGVWIRDLDSRNFTRIDGVVVQLARAEHGSVIRLGNVEIKIDFEDAEKRPVSTWRDDRFGSLIGGSAPMRELFAQLARVAPTEASVLIRGETGTGKELVARAIHDGSARAKAPFLVVDCAALPESLLESELYGHTKGAFTGAVGTRSGVFEAAEGGTVFLDEIGELPLALQPKLLRVLESRVVRRLGESQHRPVDVRFVAATHRDLLGMVSDGSFREDLYFRISVLPIAVPPLRERLSDVPLLVRHMLPPEQHGLLTPEVEARLSRLTWRGNVRELRNFVDRACALGFEGALGVMHAEERRSTSLPVPSMRGSIPDLEGPPSSSQSPASAPPETGVPPEKPLDDAIYDRLYKDFREEWIDHGEREYIRRRLLKHGHNVSAVSREVELARAYIYRLIKKHAL